MSWERPFATAPCHQNASHGLIHVSSASCSSTEHVDCLPCTQLSPRRLHHLHWCLCTTSLGVRSHCVESILCVDRDLGACLQELATEGIRTFRGSVYERQDLGCKDTLVSNTSLFNPSAAYSSITVTQLFNLLMGSSTSVLRDGPESRVTRSSPSHQLGRLFRTFRPVRWVHCVVDTHSSAALHARSCTPSSSKMSLEVQTTFSRLTFQRRYHLRSGSSPDFAEPAFPSSQHPGETHDRAPCVMSVTAMSLNTTVRLRNRDFISFCCGGFKRCVCDPTEITRPD